MKQKGLGSPCCTSKPCKGGGQSCPGVLQTPLARGWAAPPQGTHAWAGKGWARNPGFCQQALPCAHKLPQAPDTHMHGDRPEDGSLVSDSRSFQRQTTRGQLTAAHPRQEHNSG